MPIKKLLSIVSVLAGLLAGSSLQAADPAWDFEHHGEITFGYRFTDVRGYTPKFEELFNLKKGFRVEDISVRGDARERASAFSDAYALTATGLGGDPFTTAQLTTGKSGVYDVRATWRQSRYYWNRNDDTTLPVISASPSLSTGLTGNHDWTTVRKLGSIDLTLHATRNLRFTVDIARTSTDGPTRTTRTLDYLNAPNYWHSFARANSYVLDAPLEDHTYRFAGGVDYTWRLWDFHYVTGYQSFTENVNLSPVTPGETSINPATLSQSEPLNALAWSQMRKLITPVSEFSFRGSPRADLEWRGSYIYSHYRGPAALSATMSGTAPMNSANALAPYTLTETVTADVQESAHSVTEGFTWRPGSHWALDVDSRYSRYMSESENSIVNTFNGAPSFGSDDVLWKNGIGELAVNVLVTPSSKLMFRPGIRLVKTDIVAFEDGVLDAPRTHRIKRAQPELRVGYTPSSKFSVRGSLTNSVSNVSYTPLTPHTRTSGKVMARVQPLSNISIENSFSAFNASLLDSNFRNTVRSNSTIISYVWNEQVSLFGGFTYDSFYAQGDIEYARGVAPMSFLRDQEIHRVWQAGFDVKPIHSVGIRASGNYDRLTGEGVILAEPPGYGPARFPFVSASVYYDCDKLGRLSVDLARTYYIEELVTADNFSANLLTVRLTRKF
ncbi:MAG TPA: hypothetical protein VFY29_03760 [Terriglobia bacterium]|nr:hypothetical protein [Terriglobia bacterium]